jgi:hypothetical protein
MSALTQLSLATNDLVVLPETFDALTLLTSLDVSENAIGPAWPPAAPPRAPPRRGALGR